MTLITVETYRAWAGAQANSVSDELIQITLDEAQAALATEVDASFADIAANDEAVAIARGDILRRSSNLLAARNSPEGVSGNGEFGASISVPSAHPTSQRAVRQIRAALALPEAVA